MLKTLEDLVIDILVDPSNTQVSKALTKHKNEDIVALRKQLKLPHNEHPQEKEILQQQKENDDMMQLVLKMTAQVKEMENQIEALMKESEALKGKNVSSIPTVIPTINTTVPSTLAEHLAPKGVLATAVSIQSVNTSATESSTTQVQQATEADDIVKFRKLRQNW